MARLGTYAIVSSVVTIFDYLLFATLTFIVGLSPVAANAGSWLATIFVAYGLHSAFTFKMKFSLARLGGFAAVSATTLVASTLCIASLATLGPMGAKVVSTVIVFALSFVLSHSTVFRADC